MSRRLLVALAIAGLLLVGAAAALVQQHAHDFRPGDSGEGLVVYAGIWIVTGLVALQSPSGKPRRSAHGRARVRGGLGTALLGRVCALRGVQAAREPRAGDHRAPLPRVPERSARDGLERRLVEGVYCAWLVLAPLGALMWDPRLDDGCPECPANPFRVVGLDSVAPVFQAATDILVVGVFVVTGVLLVRKLRAARGATRRALAPFS